MAGTNESSSKLWLAAILVFFMLQALAAIKLRAWMDESWLSIPAYSLITEGKLAIPAFDISEKSEKDFYVPPPFQQILLAGVFKIFGTGLIQGRALSLLFGMLTILFTFLLARHLFGPVAALVAAGLLAVDNLNFLASVTIRPEILVSFLALLSVFLFFQFLERRSSSFALASGLAVGLALTTHPHGAVALVSLLVLFPVTMRGRLFSEKGFYLFLGGIFFAMLPYILYLVREDLDSGFYLLKSQVLRRAPLVSGRVAQDASPFSWLLVAVKKEILERYRDYLLFPYRVPVALSFLGSILVVFFARRKKELLLIRMVFVSLAVLALTDNKTARYLAILSPYLSVLVGATICSSFSLSAHRNRSLVSSVKQRVLRSVLAVGLLGGFGVTQLLGNVGYLYMSRGTDYYRFIKLVREKVPEGASIHGSVTFWLGLYDHPYYASEGFSFNRSIEQRPADVYILSDSESVSVHERQQLSLMNDRVRYKSDRSQKAHSSALQYMAKNGTIIAELNHPLYGNVKIYRLIRARTAVREG